LSILIVLFHLSLLYASTNEIICFFLPSSSISLYTYIYIHILWKWVINPLWKLAGNDYPLASHPLASEYKNEIERFWCIEMVDMVITSIRFAVENREVYTIRSSPVHVPPPKKKQSNMRQHATLWESAFL
jgi:hypothetical protein